MQAKKKYFDKLFTFFVIDIRKAQNFVRLFVKKVCF